LIRDGEVTLRQLYLTFRAGLLLIVVVAVVCAVAAFVLVGARGARYVSAATVLVTPPPVGSSSLSGLEVSVPSGLDLEAYRALAFESEMIEGIAARHGVAGSELLGRIELVSRTAASQVRGHLTVEHVVTGSTAGVTPAMAAAIANDWAGATSEAAARLMTTPIDQAIEAVTVETAARKAEFDAASEAWSEFLGVDERRTLNENLDALAELASSQRARLADLGSMVAAASARSAALEGALTSRVAGSADATASTQLIVDQLTVLAGERAALEAERDHLTGVSQRTVDESEAVRARLTALEGRAATLQRDLASASMTFYRVAPVGPTLQVQRDLVARSANVAVKATVPLLPEAQSRLTFAVAAAAIGGLLATLFVFLRAAVRDPER
jgi:uncharacterized protein involved in exopolysaccharide biosynthesis